MKLKVAMNFNRSSATLARFLVAAIASSTVMGCGAHSSPKTTPSSTEQEEFIIRQREEMRKQERELEDLKRQRYHDEYLRSRYPAQTEK